MYFICSFMPFTASECILCEEQMVKRILNSFWKVSESVRWLHGLKLPLLRVRTSFELFWFGVCCNYVFSFVIFLLPSLLISHVQLNSNVDLLCGQVGIEMRLSCFCGRHRAKFFQSFTHLYFPSLHRICYTVQITPIHFHHWTGEQFISNL